MKCILVLFTLVYFLFIPQMVYAKVKWRFSGEIGTYRTSGSDVKSSLHLLTRCDGFFKYHILNKHDTWFISLQFNPELYGNNNIQSVLKFLANGQYLRYYKRWNWGVKLDSRKYLYTLNKEKVTLDIFNLHAIFNIFVQQNLMLTFQPAYYARDFTDFYDQCLDAYVGRFNLIKTVTHNFYSGIGFYFENFKVKEKKMLTFLGENPVNDGQRYGPIFYLQYHKHLFFTLRYLFLIHKSTATTDPSHEHYIRFVMSKLFHQRWTFLFLIDYYWNKFTFPDQSGSPVVYIPFDNENRLDLKLEYLITRNRIIYFKMGYFRENLVLGNLVVKGWRTMLGLEINF
jgi:hypothetical protein